MKLVSPIYFGHDYYNSRIGSCICCHKLHFTLYWPQFCCLCFYCKYCSLAFDLHPSYFVLLPCACFFASFSYFCATIYCQSNRTKSKVFAWDEIIGTSDCYLNGESPIKSPNWHGGLLQDWCAHDEDWGGCKTIVPCHATEGLVNVSA